MMKNFAEKSISAENIALLLSSIMLVIPLGLAVYLGTFNRLYADDFCAVWVIRSMNLWDAIVFWYTTWTVRYTSVVLVSLQGLGWVPLAQWMPGLYLVFWVAALAWALRPAFDFQSVGVNNRRGWLLAAVAGLVMVLSTLYMAPNLVQSFYWQSARTAYTYPLVIGTVLAGWFVRQAFRSASWLGVFLFGLLAWVNSGLSEVYTAVQIVLFGMLAGVVWVFGGKDLQKRLIPFALSGLAASILGIVVILAAPGNQARITASSANLTTDLVQLILLSLKYAFKLGLSFGAIYRWIFLLLVVIGLTGGMAAAPAREDKHTTRTAILRLALSCGMIILACFGLVTAASAPPVYALGSDLDPRAQVVPLYLIVFTVLLCAFLIGRQFFIFIPRPDRRFLLASGLAMGVVVALLAGWMSSKALQVLPEHQAQAQAWDQRDLQLTAASRSGQLNVEAPGLPSWQGMQDLRVESDFWVNDCMAKTYGLQSIRGK